MFFLQFRVLICLFVFLIRKRWHLFPPEDTPFLYPTRIPYEESSVFSKVNAVNPDLKRFPQFQKARRHVVTLSPGQVNGGFKTLMTSGVRGHRSYNFSVIVPRDSLFPLLRNTNENGFLPWCSAVGRWLPHLQASHTLLLRR